MAKPFDATLKELIESYPRDWLAQLGVPATVPIQIIDADLSTVTAQADKIIRVDEETPWILDLEPQASRKEDLAIRAAKYAILIYDRHHLPVETVILLLRREADHPSLTGVLRIEPPHRRSSLEFHYQVIRLWEQPVEPFLAGGLGTLPLAPLCRVRRNELPGVVRRMEARLDQEATPGEAATLWTVTYVLWGLRYPREFAAQLLRGVRGMKESVTYQAILEEGEEKGRAEGEAKGRVEGRVEEARRFLLLLGAKHLGAPNADQRASLEAIADVARLERMAERLLEVRSWDELLATP